MNISDERKKIYKRLFLGYLGIAMMMAVALIFSYAQGADWKPLISASHIYITFFVLVSYHFVKDIRRQGRKERGEPEPPPRRGPWEEE